MKHLILGLAILAITAVSAKAQQRQQPPQPAKYNIDSTSSFGAPVNTLVVNAPQFNGNVATVSSALVYVGKSNGFGQFSFRDVVTLPDTASLKYAINTIAKILAVRRGVNIH